MYFGRDVLGRRSLLMMSRCIVLSFVFICTFFFSIHHFPFLFSGHIWFFLFLLHSFSSFILSCNFPIIQDIRTKKWNEIFSFWTLFCFSNSIPYIVIFFIVHQKIKNRKVDGSTCLVSLLSLISFWGENIPKFFDSLSKWKDELWRKRMAVSRDEYREKWNTQGGVWIYRKKLWMPRQKGKWEKQ